jgi:ABC-type uncharacterized transport system substrate-binding protein
MHQFLNGARQGDIPFYRSTKFQLLINLEAAKALNLNVPTALVRMK